MALQPRVPCKRLLAVHTVVNIKIEDDEDGFLHILVNDTKWRAPPDKDSEPSKTVKRATKPVGPQRTENKGLQAYMGDDATTAAAPALSLDVGNRRTTKKITMNRVKILTAGKVGKTRMSGIGRPQEEVDQGA